MCTIDYAKPLETLLYGEWVPCTLVKEYEQFILVDVEDRGVLKPCTIPKEYAHTRLGNRPPKKVKHVGWMRIHKIEAQHPYLRYGSHLYPTKPDAENHADEHDQVVKVEWEEEVDELTSG